MALSAVFNISLQFAVGTGSSVTFNSCDAWVSSVTFAHNETNNQYYPLANNGVAYNSTTGIAPVLTASGKREVGEQVTIIGGGLTGCEIAYELFLQGKKPTIVEMMDKIANGESSTILPTIMADFRAHNVGQYVNTKVSAIEAGAVKATRGEEEITIPCDMVVMAVGSKKNVLDVEGVSVPVYYAGDCSGERTASIAEAIRGGYKAANEI